MAETPETEARIKVSFSPIKTAQYESNFIYFRQRESVIGEEKAFAESIDGVEYRELEPLKTEDSNSKEKIYAVSTNVYKCEQSGEPTSSGLESYLQGKEEEVVEFLTDIVTRMRERQIAECKERKVVPVSIEDESLLGLVV